MMVGIGIDGRAECEDDMRTGRGGGGGRRRANARGATKARSGLTLELRTTVGGDST